MSFLLAVRIFFEVPNPILEVPKMIQLTRGNIIWLKEREEIDDDDIEGHGQPNDGCFNHPVVVLRTNRAKTEVTIFTASKMFTSFLQQ
jgi:hypothetical protein